MAPDQGRPTLLTVSFYGVRGSTPCACEANRRYGGNTACVALEVPREPPIVLDLGTGLRLWGATQPVDGSFRGAALLTHLHWDHVQGLPFFAPADRPGAEFDIYGPADVAGSLADAFSEFMRPPYFPIGVGDLRGEIRFHEVDGSTSDLAVGNAKVRARPVPHVGATYGYRVDWGGASVAYVSDHQQPVDDPTRVVDEVLDLCDGVDLLVHDAQFTPEEFAERAHWGHCTIDYAVEVARQAGARRLALFHHDPAHADDRLDALVAEARERAAGTGIEEVVAAAEGLTIAFE